MATQMTKSQLIEKIATPPNRQAGRQEHDGTLTEVGYKELKKNGVFLVPGFAKFVVVKRPATKARKGINPFTGQEMMFKAKRAEDRPRPPGEGRQASGLISYFLAPLFAGTGASNCSPRTAGSVARP